jgi:hypothetical protein
MKYLKTKNISKFSIKDNTYIQNTYGRITIDSNNSIRLPKGTTDERPRTRDVATLENPALPNLSGAIRYNTTTNSIEAYMGAPGEEVWEIVRAPSSESIFRQTIGPGDAEEIYFGPLRPEFAGKYLSSGNNIIVLVENVWQIWQTNFNIVQNPTGTPTAGFYGDASTYPEGYYLEFTDDIHPVPIGKNVTVYYGFV